MAKYVLNVTENWYRRYEIDIPDGPSHITDATRDLVVDTYKRWMSGKYDDDLDERILVLDGPEYIDDGDPESWILEEIYE